MKDRIKAIKGILLFIAFSSIAFAILQVDHSSTVISMLESVGIGRDAWVVLFVVAGVGNLFVGITGRHWNAMFFAPYFVYTASAWAVYPAVPIVPLILYTLLASFLLIDLLTDVRMLWKTEVY